MRALPTTLITALHCPECGTTDPLDIVHVAGIPPYCESCRAEAVTDGCTPECLHDPAERDWDDDGFEHWSVEAEAAKAHEARVAARRAEADRLAADEATGYAVRMGHGA